MTSSERTRKLSANTEALARKGPSSSFWLMEQKPSRHPDNLELRAISDEDFDRLVELDEEYLSSGREKLTQWRAEHPRLFRGAFLDGKLVGICYPKPTEGAEIVLEGIAVSFDLWRKGIGSRLLADFENEAFSGGFTGISLGSTPDAPTEGFYIKNGYRAIQIVLHRKVGGDPPLAEAPMRPDSIRVEGNMTVLRFDVDGYVPELRDALKAHYGADHAIFIFWKDR